MPATQQMNSSPSRQASSSNQSSQSMVHHQPQISITSQTISTVTKALDENNFALLRQIANINDDHKQLVESFTSKFVTNKKQVKMTQGPSGTNNVLNNLQGTSSSDGVRHQRINTQNVNQATPQSQQINSQQRLSAQQIIKQVMSSQRHPFPPGKQPVSPTYSGCSSDTTSSDDDMMGFEQMAQGPHHESHGLIRHIQLPMDNLQPQMQRLPTPVQKPLEQGLLMKQEDITKLQAAKNNAVRSVFVGKKTQQQQQMFVAAGNMASHQTLSGGQVAFASQARPQQQQQHHQQKAQPPVGQGQNLMVQMPQPRLTCSSQQLNIHQSHPQPQGVHQQQSQMVQQNAPVLMRRVNTGKKTSKSKKGAKSNVDGGDPSGGSHTTTALNQTTPIVASQLTQSNVQPTNHNGGAGTHSGTVESSQTNPGKNLATSGQLQNQLQLGHSKGTLAIRVSEMTTEVVQQHVQMALGQNIRVQMSPQKAMTQVINSTGLRQTAPRPLMSNNMIQKVSVRPGNIQQQHRHAQAAIPLQVRSDQRMQATMYQQMQTSSDRRHDSLQTTATHHVRQPYMMASGGQHMVRPRMQQQHIRHQTPMTNVPVNTTGQNVQMATSDGTRLANPQSVMVRQPNNQQQMVMRQQMQQQQAHVRPDGSHQFVQVNHLQSQQQGNPQFRGQQVVHQQHHGMQQQVITQSELIAQQQQQHQFVNSVHGDQTIKGSAMKNAVVCSRQQLVQGIQSAVPQVQTPQGMTPIQSDASQDSMSVSSTSSNSQQDTPMMNAVKEPNIMPLSSSDANMCSVPSAGSQENLVKGQEYLIQYSNGKKVIGIWDGRFFKVKNSQSQESGIDESPIPSQSPVVGSSQQSMMGAAGDPEAMAGSGGAIIEKKLKSTPVGMIVAGINEARPSNENSPSEPSALYDVKRPTKRPPRPREDGKFAVCKNCGAYSADYDNCDSCHKPIPENAKLFKPDASPVGNANKKMRSEAEFPAGASIGTPDPTGKSTKLLLLQAGSNQGTPGMDKKLFYGKNAPSSAAALVIAQAEANLAGGNQKTPGSARGGRGKGKASRGRGKNAKKSSQIETVTILSSDDDEDSLPGQYPGGIMPPNTSTAAGVDPAAVAALAQAGMAANPAVAGQHVKAGFRARMEDETGKVVGSKRVDKQKTQAQTSSLASQDLSTILVQLQSRSIRIGSYRGTPADHFKVTVQGVQFTIAWGEDCLQIHIGSNEITKVVCHLGESMPCMFLDTTPTCAQRLRQALEMIPGKDPYYDPQSEDEVHKRITVIFENLGEMGIENYIRALFQVMQAGNPYFQKEGNLLEEIEYQQANEILIQSTPQAHLQLLTLGLGPGFPPDGEEDDEPVDRSRSPSPARIFNGQIVKLFTYPPPPSTGGITVTNEDLFCLNDGEFLNDVIIDFYLKYIYFTKLSEEMRQRTHIFSSFFYRRLTSKQAKRNEENNSIQERRHARVKTWTRHIDLFEKDHVIVPINESAHWYLAILSFPGLTKPVYHMDRSKSPAEVAAAAKESSPSDSTQKTNTQDSEKQSSTQKTEENMETDENSTASEQGVQSKRIQKQACIMIFDSLAGPSRTSVIRTLREYLQVEWDTKKKDKCGERTIDKDTMKGANPKCPQQLNFSDCGIYVLQYVESFFESPPQDYNIPIRGLQEWFSEETALCKREELRQLLVALQKQLNPALQYDPSIDGCMISGVEDDDDDLPDLIKEEQKQASLLNAGQAAAAVVNPAINQSQVVTMANPVTISANGVSASSVSVARVLNLAASTVQSQQNVVGGVATAAEQTGATSLPAMSVAVQLHSQNTVVQTNTVTTPTSSPQQDSVHKTASLQSSQESTIPTTSVSASLVQESSSMEHLGSSSVAISEQTATVVNSDLSQISKSTMNRESPMDDDSVENSCLTPSGSGDILPGNSNPCGSGGCHSTIEEQQVGESTRPESELASAGVETNSEDSQHTARQPATHIAETTTVTSEISS